MNDLISKQEAIKIVKRYLLDCHVEDADWHGDGIEYELKNLPPAQQWIQVTERLPDETGWFLTSISRKFTDELYTLMRWYSKAHGFEILDTAEEYKAWMPMPEPYKEVE